MHFVNFGFLRVTGGPKRRGGRIYLQGKAARAPVVEEPKAPWPPPPLPGSGGAEAGLRVYVFATRFRIGGESHRVGPEAFRRFRLTFGAAHRRNRCAQHWA